MADDKRDALAKQNHLPGPCVVRAVDGAGACSGVRMNLVMERR